jgi:hypothetical protein
VANKGLAKRHFLVSVQKSVARRGMPPRVFCKKRLQTVENKGKECRKERKETTKRLQTAENMGFATPTRSGQAPAQRPNGVTPRAIQIVVKIKGLREKQFVRV